MEHIHAAPRDCDTTSDSDSDKETNWKKKSIRDDEDSFTYGNNGACDRKKKAHEMWTDRLTEQTLLDGFGQCKLKKPSTSVYDRGCESYDFDAKLFQSTKSDDDDSPGHSEKYEKDMDFSYDYSNKNEDEGIEEFGVCTKKKKIKLPKVKERLGDKSFGKFSTQKVANKIVSSLKEKKPELIQRCVQFLGPKKALELLNMTLTVEESGGIMTKDGSRRRTPGGVYIQLLKDDVHIKKDTMDKIFQDDKRAQNDMKKSYRKMVQKQMMKKQQMESKRNVFSVVDSPVSCTVFTATTVVSENTCTSDVEEGEIMD